MIPVVAGADRSGRPSWQEAEAGGGTSTGAAAGLPPMVLMLRSGRADLDGRLARERDTTRGSPGGRRCPRAASRRRWSTRLGVARDPLRSLMSGDRPRGRGTSRSLSSGRSGRCPPRATAFGPPRAGRRPHDRGGGSVFKSFHEITLSLSLEAVARRSAHVARTWATRHTARRWRWLPRCRWPPRWKSLGARRRR